MCKSLADGGGRCFYHLNKELVKAEEKVASARSEGNVESYISATQEHDRIQLQVDSTRTGQNNLKNEIAATGDPNGMLEARLKLGELTINSEKNRKQNKVEALEVKPSDTDTVKDSKASMSDIVSAALIAKVPFIKEPDREKGSNMHENITANYVRLCEEKGVKPDLIGYSRVATGYQSKVGNYLEMCFSTAVNSKLPENAQHFIGKEVERSVTSYRKSINSDIAQKDNIGIAKVATPDEELKKEAIDKLHETYHLNKQWTEKMLTPAKSEITSKGSIKHTYHKISLPDSITVFTKENGEKEVRIGEAKLSGQLDSKNLPKNIEDLMAKGPYDDIPNTKVERAILLTGTRQDAKGDFPMSNAWVNEIRKKNLSLPVECNQNAFKWASKEEISKDEYHVGILKPIEKFSAERIYKQLHS